MTCHVSPARKRCNARYALNGKAPVTNCEESRIINVEEATVKGRKCIVFESCLDKLLCLVKCPHPNCPSPVGEIKKNILGSLLSVSGKCVSGHSLVIWESQPIYEKIPVGNLILSSAILLSGSNFKKVAEMLTLCGIENISQTTYYRHLRRFLFPAIDLNWKAEENRLRLELRHKALCVAGDAQFHRPGHGEKYFTYAFMDVLTDKIIGFKILQAGQGISLDALEKKAFETCLNSLLAEQYDIQVICTDRHASIEKTMRENFKNIHHQYDTWHFAKYLLKKLVTASARKGCKQLGHWMKPIITHFWWSAQTCNGNTDLLREKLTSVIKHVTNIHFWDDGKLYHSCSHQQIPEDEVREIPWISLNDDCLETLHDTFLNKPFLEELNCLQRFCHTKGLGFFHSKVLKYRPKRNHFEMGAMEAWTKLAALSYNRNVKKKVETIINPRKSCKPLGTQGNRLFFPKAPQKWIVRPIYQETDNSFLRDIMRDALLICQGELDPNTWESITGSLH
ncbi:LOW QUALITY PROTEIN: uncharacterized protein RCH25_047219 [Pelodytes ibericus]